MGDLYQEHIKATYKGFGPYMLLSLFKLYFIKALQCPALNKHFVGLTWGYGVMLF